MTPRLTRILAATTLALLACSKSNAGTASDPGIDRFVQACLASSNLPQPICECTAKKAKDQLSPNGFAFLTASLAKEDAKVDELRGKLSVQEAMAAGTFMARGPVDCARELGGTPTEEAPPPNEP